MTDTLPSIPPPPDGWSVSLRKYYLRFEELFREKGNDEGLKALSSFAELGANLKNFGSAKLSIRFRDIENAIGGDPRGLEMIDAFGDAFDSMVDDVVRERDE